jgi:hypothetical protein
LIKEMWPRESDMVKHVRTVKNRWPLNTLPDKWRALLGDASKDVSKQNTAKIIKTHE